MALVASSVLAGVVGPTAPVAWASPASPEKVSCVIPADKVSVTAVHKDSTDGKVRAGDRFRVKVSLTGLDGLPEGCVAVVVFPEYLDKPEGLINLYLNADGTATRTLQNNTVVVMDSEPEGLVFTTTGYPSKHTKVSAAGWADAKMVSGLSPIRNKEKIQWGETLPVIFKVNRVKKSGGAVTTAPCDGACPGIHNDQVRALGTQYHDLDGEYDREGSNGLLEIVTPVVKDAGTLVSIRNELTGGQFIDNSQSILANEYNCVNETGDWGVENDDRCDTAVRSAQMTGSNGDFTIRTTRPNALIRLLLPIRLNGPGPWPDTVTVSTPDMTRQQRVTIQPFLSTVGGSATGATPSSSASTSAGSATPPVPSTKQSAAPSVAATERTGSTGAPTTKPAAQARKGAPSSTEAAIPAVGSTGGSPSTSVTAPSQGATGSSVQASTKPTETARPVAPSAPPKQVGPKVKQVGPKVETDQVGTTGFERVGLWAAVSTLAMAGLGGGVIARRRRSNS